MFNILKNIFWTTKAEYVRKVHETNDIYTFIFKLTNRVTWQPGQYIDFMLPSGKIKHFTIASAPYENEVRLTTRIFENPSPFKKELISLKQRSLVRLSQPQGSLTLQDDIKNYLFIAGGIGITPYRAIIWHLFHTMANVSVTLLYLSSTANPAFKNELIKISKEYPNLKLKFYINEQLSPEEIEKLVDKETAVYISGPPKMVEAYTKTVSALKIISKRNLRSDPFIGYFD